MDFRKIRKAALEQGWRVKQTKSGETFYPPDPRDEPVTWHFTPSDQRAVRNFLARLKKGGLIWPPPKKRG